MEVMEMAKRSRWMLTAASGLLVVLLSACLVLFFQSVNRDSSAPQCSEDLGILFSDTTDGLQVLAVLDGSRACQSGIHPGDLIVAADNVPLSSIDQLDSLILNRISAGAEALSLRVERSEDIRNTSLDLSYNKSLFRD